jgi:hypothetical protein
MTFAFENILSRAGITFLAALILAGCAATASGPTPVAATDLRDLTEAEKQVIAAGLAGALKERSVTRYEWGKFPAQPSQEEVRYCAKVNGKPFVVTVTMSGGKISSAQLVAVGGSTGGFVDQECRRHYATPFA